MRRRVRITLDEQLRGGRVELQVSRTEYCSECGGSGSGETLVSCDNCGGSGQVRPSLGWLAFFPGAPTPCTDCGGEGVTRPKCAACDGKGTIARKRGQLSFDIPAGVPPGGSLRVRGHGRRGRSGRVSGDLLVNVEIQAHPLFQPDFPHLRCDMPISIFRALAGGVIEVPTLNETVLVSLPADLVDGTELIVAGHGMLNGATGARGDLSIRLRLIRPRKFSDAQRDLLAKLDRLAARRARARRVGPSPTRCRHDAPGPGRSAACALTNPRQTGRWGPSIVVKPHQHRGSPPIAAQQFSWDPLKDVQDVLPEGTPNGHGSHRVSWQDAFLKF